MQLLISSSCLITINLKLSLQMQSIDVYWTAHHLDNWKNKIQINATYYFIIIMLGPTCFVHHYAHRHELTMIALVIT